MKNRIRKSSMLIDLKRRFVCFGFLLFELLCLWSEFVYNSLTNYQKKIILEEIKIANLSSNDKVLFIGCGLIPLTPITIVEEVKSNVVTIDNINWIVKYARSYISKRGLSSQIRVDYGNGLTYPIHNFDVIFIATNVWPIKPILKHLSHNMKDSAKIVCRDVKNDIENILKHEGLEHKYSIEAVFEHPAGPEYKSLVLTKK